jgi:hypothetical protein
VEALLDRTRGEPPAIAFIAQQLEALGYQSWAHRLINSAGEAATVTSRETLLCLCGAAFFIQTAFLFIIDLCFYFGKVASCCIWQNHFLSSSMWTPSCAMWAPSFSV